MVENERDNKTPAPQEAAVDVPTQAQQNLYRQLEREVAEHNSRVAREQEEQKATAIKGLFYIIIAILLAVYIPVVPGAITFVAVFTGLVALDRMNK